MRSLFMGGSIRPTITIWRWGAIGSWAVDLGSPVLEGPRAAGLHASKMMADRIVAVVNLP
jgi:hypothetical protein